MAERSAQDVWLEHLNEAAQFNDWVVSCFDQQLHGTVLEIGCGIGNFTSRLARRATAITAVDLNPNYVQIAAERLRSCATVRVCAGDATTMPWPHPYDAVVMLDVLEHVEDDVGLLRHLARALVPGGLLVLKVPAAPWLYTPMDKAIGHHRRYSSPTLTQVLADGGFAIERQTYFNIAGMFGWFLNGKVLRREVPPQEQLAFFERLVPFFRWFETAVHPPLGLSLIATARLVSPGRSDLPPDDSPVRERA